MKFICTQENLSQGLSLIAPTASKNTTLPILNNVLINAHKGVITLSATNLELGVSCQVRGKVDEDGSYTVGAKLLSDFVNLSSGDTVEVILEAEILKVNTGKTQTKIKGSPAEEFPMIPTVEKSGAFVASPLELQRALEQVLFAVSHSDSRPEISGVFLKFENGSLIMAATDSYRLAEKSIRCSGVKSLEAIVPARALGEVLRVISTIGAEETAKESADNQVMIYFQDNQVQFQYKNCEVVSRLIEGTYPPYREIIPKNSSIQAIIETNTFAKAVKTASLFSRLGVFDVRIELENNQIKIEADNAQLGDAQTVVDAETLNGTGKIILNHKYLSEGLNNLRSTFLQFEMSDENSPCIIRPAEKLDGGNLIASTDYLYIIMPIKQ